MDTIVKVKELKKSFGKTAAVSGLSFEIKEGMIFGLIGPDGAGKTTTLRILAGIMVPDSGSAAVAGFSLPDEAEQVKEQCGYMPQKFSLYQDLTVNENMRFFADIFGIDEKTLLQRLTPLLKMTRLEPFANRLAGDLSGGMKQKLALMCTLIHRPKLLILDEPTTGVDPVSRREFWEILQQIRAEGVTIIVSTPYMDEAEWCNNVALLYGGEIIKEGTPQELKNNSALLVYETAAAADVIRKAGTELKSISDARPLGGFYRISMTDKADAEKLALMVSPSVLERSAVTIEDVFIENLSGGKK